MLRRVPQRWIESLRVKPNPRHIFFPDFSKMSAGALPVAGAHAWDGAYCPLTDSGEAHGGLRSQLGVQTSAQERASPVICGSTNPSRAAVDEEAQTAAQIRIRRVESACAISAGVQWDVGWLRAAARESHSYAPHLIAISNRVRRSARTGLESRIIPTAHVKA